MKLLNAVREKGIWVVPLLIAVVLWEVVAAYVVRNSALLPRFSEVIFAFYLLRHDIVPDIIVSLLHFSIGLTVAFFLALPLGIGMGWFKTVFKAVDPLIEILRPIPPLAWIPLAIVWFHLTHYAAGFIIFLGAFFPILIGSYTGFRDVPKVLVETGKVLGCIGHKKMIRYVAFPYALPSVATGTRVGMGVGWMSLVAAEMFGVSTSGLGYRLFNEFYYWKQMDFVIAYMLLLGLISLFLDRVFRRFVEARFFRWKRGIVK
jgi:NitT/TauT family transport system permease protein